MGEAALAPLGSRGPCQQEHWQMLQSGRRCESANAGAVRELLGIVRFGRPWDGRVCACPSGVSGSLSATALANAAK